MIFLRLLPLLLLISCSNTVTTPPVETPTYTEYNPYHDEEQIAYCSPKELAPKPLRKRKIKTIVIDPGHGGKDNGTHSTKTPPYKEKELNLATAKLIQRYLQKLNYRVLMTRTEDEAVDLQDRAAFANQCKCDLFVSIHYNSAPNKDAHGIEVYFYQSKDNPQRTLASEKLAQQTLNSIVEKTQAKPRGARKGNFAVIRETNMPAILIEGGFLTNAKERDNILTLEYRKKLAQGIVQGIEHYFAAQKLAPR